MDSGMNDQEQIPVVSVLVTSYNREKFISQTIESILNQKYQSFEIIICDNCSTDNTMKELGKYSANSKIRIFQNEVNIGQFPNRNKVAGYAKGKYLKYVDSDDLLYPSCLEIMVDAMEKFPEAGFGLFSEQDDRFPSPFVLNSGEAFEYHYLRSPIFERSPLGAIIRRDAFEKSRGFRDISIAGDFEMWHRLACNYPLVIIGNGLGWYRVHNSQEMIHYSKNIQQYNEIRSEFLNKSKSPLNNALREKIVEREKSSLLKHTFRNLMRFKFETARRHYLMYNLFRNI